MSSDGCLEVAWKGNPFPYLLHQPGSGKFGGPPRTEGQQNSSYSQQPQDTRRQRAATGTWDGPAPRGGITSSSAPSQQAQASSQPDTVFLSSGHRIPAVGLGTYQISSPEVIRTALEVGYRHFDCASCYDNEAIVGEGLREFISEGRRSELFITSKVWNDAHRPQALRASCRKSIEDLGCTYLDLYLVHWPEAWVPGGGSITEDTEVTLTQTWEAMQLLVDDGLVKSIGVSNFSLKQVEELLASARIKPCVNQVELQPLLAQRKLLGVCLRKGVQCVAYAPLGHNREDLLQHGVVQRIAAATGKTPAQVLLKWNVQRGVPVVPKASSREHLQENLQLFDWVLSHEHKGMLDELDAGKRFVDFPWKNWGNPAEGGAAKPSQLLYAH